MSVSDLLVPAGPQESRHPNHWLSRAAPADAWGAGYVAAQPAVTRPFPAAAESVGTARGFAREALRDWGMTDLADLAELVVSELVTNAVRHGVPSARKVVREYPIRLRLLAQPPFVMCMVTDPGADIPVLRESDPAAECGRGLHVVESSCVRWGWHLLDEGGKVVWALMRPPA
ncbi:MAG TPA: ATP-binding protein [Streptosporangiaceae bacterium]|nr:ATP-binding protein [Streptosporangiaceae bacterium]